MEPSVPVSDHNGDQGVTAAARSVAEHASTLARSEVQLALLELKAKVAALGIGAGLFAGAAVLAALLISLLIAAATAGLATAMPVWAALLVMAAIVLVLIAVLALLGRASIRKGSPPLPERAIREAKLTTESL